MTAQSKVEPDTRNIAQRIAAVMGEVDYVQKEKKQGMNYSIVSHDAVTAKVRPLLHKHGVVYYPRNMVVAQVGNRTEAQFDVRFENVNDRTDFIDVATFGYGVDPQDKGPGKAMSYGVKYALLKVLGLETGDDPDTVQDTRADYNPAAEPEPMREKVPGITKIKERLGNLMRVGNRPEITLEEFNELVSANKADLTTIKEASHDYWTGDGEDSEGFKAWIVRRRAELAPVEETVTYQLLVSTLLECETPAQVQTWLGKNGDVVESLDGEESTKFGKIFDVHEAQVAADATRTPVDAG